VVCLALLALAVQILYVVAGAPNRLAFSDALGYQLQANYLASGRGFVDPLLLAFQHQVRPTAAHPPLYVLFLAAGSTLGAKSVMAHQLMGCVAGTATVVGCGLIGAELGGDRTGLTAMAVAALYPGLWVTDGGIMSEGLFALLSTAVMIAAYHYCRRRSVRAAIILGMTIGLAVLTRDAAALLLIVLAVPLVLTGPMIGIRRRLVHLVAIVVAAGVVISPWVIRNLVTFDRTVIISTANGGLLGANCPNAYYGPGIGLWYQSCYASMNVPADADESVANADAQHAGITFLRHNLTRLPVVVAARVGRTWELYQPVVDANNDRDDGRPHWAALLSLWSYFMVALLAAVGMALLIRRRRNVLPLVAQIAAVTITAATTWGSVRFRAPVEPVLAVLAAVALSSLVPPRHRQTPNIQPRSP
jgi:4-amino-4-deoxy-L-arabinose transferase-like glycosyltransferase